MTLEEWKQYYADNIILQYKQKPKAVETVKAIVAVNFVLNILDELRIVWDIDNSKGRFLDIIGELFGVDRSYSGLDLKGKYFATPFSGEDIDTPTPVQAGFLDRENEDIGEWFMPEKANYALYDIEDDKIEEESKEGVKKHGDYRKILKMKIFSRTCNNSLCAIQKYLDDNFPNVYVDEKYEPVNQVIYKTDNIDDFELFSIMRAKNVLPRVAGVECIINF